ncbi:MAG: hypothetical protein AAF366_10020 [Pseudomonadota bacterium]
MNDDDRPFSEDELLAFAQGRADSGLAVRIETARADDPGLAAELALMAGLKPALAGAAGAVNPPGEMGWRRLEAAIGQQAAPARAAGSVALWRAAAVVFGLAAIGQGLYFGTGQDGTAPGYQTASDEIFEHVLAIGLQPDATEAEIRAVLQAANARLVDGPGASGLYRVAFETAAALADGRLQLEAAEIVQLVLEE